MLVVEVVFFVDQKVKIDDPVGAVGVHFANGLWGVLALGIFANGHYGVDALGKGLGWNGTTTHLDRAGSATGVTGILYGGTGWGQLAAQVIGCLVIIVVMGAISWGFFRFSKVLFKGIRTDPEVEVAGLDVPEMGVLAYPDFTGTQESLAETKN